MQVEKILTSGALNSCPEQNRHCFLLKLKRRKVTIIPETLETESSDFFFFSNAFTSSKKEQRARVVSDSGRPLAAAVGCTE